MPTELSEDSWDILFMFGMFNSEGFQRVFGEIRAISGGIRGFQESFRRFEKDFKAFLGISGDFRVASETSGAFMEFQSDFRGFQCASGATWRVSRGCLKCYKAS